MAVNRWGVMARLLVLLCAALFLTLLIGGQDRGQARLGLSRPPLMPPLPVRSAAAVEAAPAAVAKLVPVARPAPAATAPAPAPEPAPDLAAAANPAAPALAAPSRATFTLSVIDKPDFAPRPETAKVLYVAATSVNVRQGPSTDDPVLGRLTRNEAVSLVGDAGDGWVQIRIEGDGIEGFVASRLLTDKAPAP